MADQTVSETLNRAADEIAGRGWTQAPEVGGWWPDPDSTNPVCLEGGINACSTGTDRAAAKSAIRDYLTSLYPEQISPTLGYVIPFSWNDRQHRTAEQVTEALRAAAVIAASREAANQTVDDGVAASVTA